MRVLLAAVNAAKGDTAANLRRHVGVLERAADQGCDLAVFPEFSLTGSVDPTRHPEHSVPVESARVRALVAATQRTGVGAIFGIAERAGDGFHITQLYAHGGRVIARHRKRHLGEGEYAYQTGADANVAALGAARFGLVICAESTVDPSWAQAAAAGAQVVFFCAAPGLDGRRRDEAGWRSGHAWWASSGLGDAIRHARRHGLWVALVTQAGATDDEDFPGLAALVSPTGRVIDRLPDWRPGELVVDIPVATEVEPARLAARALVVDDTGRTLLMRFADEDADTAWWCPPGGGIDPGEEPLDAVRRELREELGRDSFDLGPWIGRRSHTFHFGGRWMTQREQWILCRTSRFAIDAARVASLRAENVHDAGWWTADEIRAAGIDTVPRNLADLLDRVNTGVLPEPAADLGT